MFSSSPKKIIGFYQKLGQLAVGSNRDMLEFATLRYLFSTKYCIEQGLEIAASKCADLGYIYSFEFVPKTLVIREFSWILSKIRVKSAYLENFERGLTVFILI